MRLCLLSPVLLMSSLGVAAHASDVINAYTFTGVTTTDGSSLAGTITIDSTAGTVTGINATYMGDGLVNTFSSADPGISLGADGYFDSFDSDQGAGDDPSGLGATLDLDLPPSTLVGYGGSLICSITIPCGPDGLSSAITSSANNNGLGNTTDAIMTGSLVLTSGTVGTSTPEPSTLTLLASGVLGLAGVVRRRPRS